MGQKIWRCWRHGPCTAIFQNSRTRTGPGSPPPPRGVDNAPPGQGLRDYHLLHIRRQHSQAFCLLGEVRVAWHCGLWATAYTRRTVSSPCAAAQHRPPTRGRALGETPKVLTGPFFLPFGVYPLLRAPKILCAGWAVVRVCHRLLLWQRPVEGQFGVPLRCCVEWVAQSV